MGCKESKVDSRCVVEAVPVVHGPSFNHLPVCVLFQRDEPSSFASIWISAPPVVLFEKRDHRPVSIEKIPKERCIFWPTFWKLAWNLSVDPDFSWNTAHCLPSALRVSGFQFHDPEIIALPVSISSGVCPTPRHGMVQNAAQAPVRPELERLAPVRSQLLRSQFLRSI